LGRFQPAFGLLGVATMSFLLSGYLGHQHKRSFSIDELSTQCNPMIPVDVDWEEDGVII